MKKSLLFTLAMAFLFVITSCDDDESFEFALQPDAEGIVFLNSPAPRYLLSNETATNIAERIVYAPVDFGIPTVISYELQSSLEVSFGEFTVLATTPETNVAVSVRNLLDLSELIGLDQDPSTTNSDGSPNNTGVVFFRVRAFAGNGNAESNTENTSDVLSFNIELVENTGDTGAQPAMLSNLGIIFFNGEEVPDTSLLTNEEGVHFGAVNIPTDGMDGMSVIGKFREDMDFAVNFGIGAGGEFTLTMGGFGNDIPFGATGIAFITADLNNLTYSIERDIDSWGMVGDVINDFGGAGPDIRFTEDPANPGVWLAFNVVIDADGIFKFRLNDDFATNFGLLTGGSPNELMMGGFGNDIPISAGTYNVILDLSSEGSETFTLEAL